MTDLSRRGLLSFVPLLVAAPAIVRASSLMKVRAWREFADGGVIVCADIMKIPANCCFPVPQSYQLVAIAQLERLNTTGVVSIMSPRRYREQYPNQWPQQNRVSALPRESFRARTRAGWVAGSRPAMEKFGVSH